MKIEPSVLTVEMYEERRLTMSWIDANTSNGELEADDVRRRDENISTSRLVGTGGDAVPAFGSVTHRAHVVAGLDGQLRRRVARGRQRRRDEVKQGEVQPLAASHPDVPRARRRSYADRPRRHVAGQVTGNGSGRRTVAGLTLGHGGCLHCGRQTKRQ